MIEGMHEGSGERVGATEEDGAEGRGKGGGRRGEGGGGDGRKSAFQCSTDQRELSRRAQERRRQLEEERQRLCPFKPHISPARSIPKSSAPPEPHSISKASVLSSLTSRL
jgi:hypothetical protein